MIEKIGFCLLIGLIGIGLIGIVWIWVMFVITPVMIETAMEALKLWKELL